METEPIFNQILITLYEALYSGEDIYDLRELCKNEEWDENLFEKVLDRMIYDNDVKPVTIAGYSITSSGILKLESEINEPAELINKNRSFRTELLKVFADEYDKSGSEGILAYHDLADKFEEDFLSANLGLLLDIDYITNEDSNTFSITFEGLDAVEEWKQQLRLEEEFEAITGLNPQSRGMAFQKMFATLVQKNGWEQEEGVKTPNEEMDVLIFKEREYFIAECKWEKKPIEADVVRELKGKLDNRIDVRGVIISMSGFTKGAVKQVKDYISQRIIMLFGPEDFNMLLHEKISFDELLNDKYKELVTVKKVKFD